MLKKEELSEKFKGILVDKMGLEPDEIADDSLLRNDLGMDSLDTIEIIMELEKEYGVLIPDEFYDKVSTVDEAVEFVLKIIV